MNKHPDQYCSKTNYKIFFIDKLSNTKSLSFLTHNVCTGEESICLRYAKNKTNKSGKYNSGTLH